MTLDEIKEKLEDTCYNEDWEFYEDYSGRAMYGRTCPGIVHDTNGFAVAQALARDHGADFLQHLGYPAEDAMGLDRIIYFQDL